VNGWRATLAAVLLAVAVSGCGLGEKEARADRIIDAVEAAFDQPGATGTLSISQEVVSVPDVGGAPPPTPGASDVAEDLGDVASGAPTPDAPPDGGEYPPIVVDVALDLQAKEAWESYRGADVPFAAFSSTTLFGRRFNAGPRDARPWVMLDTTALERGAGSLEGRSSVPAYGAFAFSPLVYLDLMAAPLTGSVEQVGTEEVAGVRTTHYRANFDLEKMTRDTRRRQYPEVTREALETVLDLAVIQGTTHEGEVWIDEEGLPRRFQVRLRQEPFTDFKVDLIVVLELHSFGPPAARQLPTSAELVKVGSLSQYLGAALPAPGSEAFVTLVVGSGPA
jgi:hypothetical protein